MAPELTGDMLAAAGVIVAALITALAAVVGHVLGARRARREGVQTDKRELSRIAHDAAASVIDDLQLEVQRLGSRVESLELARDGYRSWSHVLWAHLHDVSLPRLPAPEWPPSLPR